MNPKRKFRKALETLVYLSNKDRRNYWILKAIYFADKEHLNRYGRQIFDDKYIAMKLGPVPSLAYDIIKSVRGEGIYIFNDPDPKSALNVPNKYTILPRRVPNLQYLSQSDIECLDFAYDKIKDLNLDQLKKISHDAAYAVVEQDDEMSLESIINILDNSQDVLEYISCP